MLRIAARARLFFLVAACLVPTAGCSSTGSCNANCCSGYTGCCGICWYSNHLHTLYDPCCKSCYGIAYSGGQCTCMDDVKDRVNQISDILLP